MTRDQTPYRRYAADLLKENVRLPLTISRDCPATIIDADGRDVATVDINRERPDPQAVKIALWIIMAVNVCGGDGAAALPAVADFLALYGEGSDGSLVATGDRAVGGLDDCCPVCAGRLNDDDICSTDIEMGICHSACLEGSAAVDLETGEMRAGPIYTYRYGDTAPATDGSSK